MARINLKLTAVVAVLWALLASAVLAQDKDVLPPDQVFKYTTRADADRVYLDFDILDGYYLYRSRFGFASGTDDIALGAAGFPRGETHTDDYFGEQEIYRGKFAIAIPYRRTGAGSNLELKLKLQGCADFGLCYLPQDWTAKIALPAAAATAGGSRPGDDDDA